MAKPVKPVDPLYAEIRGVLEQARKTAYRAVNFAMVLSYWHVGRLIVEHEQKGKKRAGYGEELLKELSVRLTEDFGKGFDESNLHKMKQFYIRFPILDAVRLKSDPKSQAKTSKKLAVSTESGPHLRTELSWTHYRFLLTVEAAEAREWYMNEAADEQWSTRQLERQISTQYYDRLLSSRKKDPVRKEAKEKMAELLPEYFIRDPYVLEFLNLQDYPALRETNIEQKIIDNLQQFLLELGKGFCFVARQKRIRLEDDDFYIDLVFYNYLLKCFVLIDLKVGKLTHQDIGQMDGYVRIYDEDIRIEGHNPTIGLILCSKKNKAIAKYLVLKESKQIFASKYVKVLPTEESLRLELERERREIEERGIVKSDEST